MPTFGSSACAVMRTFRPVRIVLDQLFNSAFLEICFTASKPEVAGERAHFVKVQWRVCHGANLNELAFQVKAWTRFSGHERGECCLAGLFVREKCHRQDCDSQLAGAIQCQEIVGKLQNVFRPPSHVGRGARGEGAKREGQEETKGREVVCSSGPLPNPLPEGEGVPVLRNAELGGVSIVEFMQFAGEREVALDFDLDNLEQDRKTLESSVTDCSLELTPLITTNPAFACIL